LFLSAADPSARPIFLPPGVVAPDRHNLCRLDITYHGPSTTSLSQRRRRDSLNE